MLHDIKCSDCQACYISEIGTNLIMRRTEHKRATRAKASHWMSATSSLHKRNNADGRTSNRQTSFENSVRRCITLSIEGTHEKRTQNV